VPIDAFISYSHADAKALDRLHKHLAMLLREGALSAWTDHKLLPGAKLDGEIGAALESSGLFLALISPDYLASKYCYDKEFLHAEQLAEEGRLRIVPIIIESCDWQASPFAKYLALPKDGKPISEWTNENNAFLDVVTGLRRILATAVVASPDAGSSPSLRRPRIKQDFDAIQKSEFADKAFDEIRSYFNASCRELNEAGDGILKAKFEEMSSTSFTCTVVNRAKQRGGEAHITVRNSKGSFGFGDISYIFEHHAENKGSNGAIRVEHDDYNLYLITDTFLRKSEGKSTPQQVAAALWLDFVRQAGIEYD
jgi:hypothetical protein